MVLPRVIEYFIITTYHICQIIQGENFHGFRGFLLTANVLPLKIFLEYRYRPLTTRSMVPHCLINNE